MKFTAFERFKFGVLPAALVLLASLVPLVRGDELDTAVDLLEFVLEADPDGAATSVRLLAEKVESGEIEGPKLKKLQSRLTRLLASELSELDANAKPTQLQFEAAALLGSWGHPAAVKSLRHQLGQADPARRLRAMQALLLNQDPAVLQQLRRLSREMLDDKNLSIDTRMSVLASWSRRDELEVGSWVLQQLPELDPRLQPKAVDLLTQRAAWSKLLLAAIADGHLGAETLDANQVGRLLAYKDPELRELVRKQWGTLRTTRNPQREAVLQEMRAVLADSRGDPGRGRVVFDRVCGQCHQIYGRGQKVGPDLTANGRSSYEQLLSNVFDPSLVIGAAYQSHTVITDDGRVLSGLVVEQSEQRVVLRMSGGKEQVIPRQDIEEMQQSQLSLMPEGIEKQLKPGELADLFSFLVLSGLPEDPKTLGIPGTPPKLLGQP